MESKFKREFCRYLDEKDVKYSELGENIFQVTFSDLKNMSRISVQFNFDNDGEGKVNVRTYDLGSFKSDDAFATGLLICNKMNTEYRWVRFYLDSDRDVVVDADAILSVGTVGEECAELMLRLIDIADKAYPEFMKALWH